MTGSAAKCNEASGPLYVALLLGEKVKKGREFEGGRANYSAWPGGCRMTGSALQCDGRCGGVCV